MPFTQRKVKPVKLGRIKIEQEYRFDLDIVSNWKLVCALKQLESLAQHADQVFSEITYECQNVVNRSERLNSRIKSLDTVVEALDAKSVKVPEGDLTTFARLCDLPYRADNGEDTALFTPASRPEHLQILYNAATENPANTIRKCNLLRTDGQTGSKLFSVTPVVLLDHHLHNGDDVVGDGFKRYSQIPEFERKSREPRQAKIRPVSMSALSELDACATSPIDAVLPTPEERLRELSRSQPVTLIPIDTSGTTFQRQCEYRESIRSVSREYLDVHTKRKQRRKTIVGIPGLPDVHDNTESFSFSHIEPKFRSISRERWERPRSMASLEHYSTRDKSKHSTPKQEHCPVVESYDEPKLARSCSLGRSLKSLFRKSKRDLWVQGEPVSPGPPVVKLQVQQSRLQRSKSLPRSLKATFRNSLPGLTSKKKSASLEDQLDASDDEEPVMHAPRRTFSQRIESHRHCEQIPGQGFRPSRGRISGSVSYHSGFTGSIPEGVETKQTKPRCTSSPRINNQRAAERQPWSGGSASTLSSSEQSIVGSPGSVTTPTNTAPKLPFNTSARMDLSTTTDDNPSTAEEDASTINNDHSDVSTANDDGDDDDTSTVNDDTTLTVDQSSSTMNGSVIDVKANFTKMRTDDWLNSLNLKKKQGNNKKLTLQNLKAHDAKVPHRMANQTSFDGASSIYSVDQDGFYTSMHMDSGLSKSQDMFESEKENFVDKNRAKTLDRYTRKGKGKKDKDKKRLSLPEKLKRKVADKQTNIENRTLQNGLHITRHNSTGNGTTSSGSYSSLGSTDTLRRQPPSVLNDSMISESDTEAIYARLRVKTNICSSGIPMMVSVTPCGSDEDEDLETEEKGSSATALNGHLNKPDMHEDNENSYKTWPRRNKMGVSAGTADVKSILKSLPQGTNSNPDVTVHMSVDRMDKHIDDSLQTLDSDGSTSISLVSSATKSSSGVTGSSGPTVNFADVTGSNNDRPLESKIVSGTWPRHKGNASILNGFLSSKQATYEMNTFPRKNAKPTPPRTLDLSQSVSTNPMLPMEASNESKGDEIISPRIPQPAQACLIISSPVASRAEYVENPHKRSVCSPVSDQEMSVLSTLSKDTSRWPKIPNNNVFEFGADVNKSPSKPFSSPIYPDVQSMKHSISFPLRMKDILDNKKYGKSWYEGITKDPEVHNEANGYKSWYEGISKAKQSPSIQSNVIQHSVSFTNGITSNVNTGLSQSISFPTGFKVSQDRWSTISDDRSSIQSASSVSSSSSKTASIDKSYLNPNTKSHEVFIENHVIDEELEMHPLKRSSSIISQNSTGSSSSHSTHNSEGSSSSRLAEPSAKRLKTKTVIKAAPVKGRTKFSSNLQKRASGPSSIPENTIWINSEQRSNSLPRNVKPVQTMLDEDTTGKDPKAGGKVIVDLSEHMAAKSTNTHVTNGSVITSPLKDDSALSTEEDIQTIAIGTTNNTTSSNSIALRTFAPLSSQTSMSSLTGSLKRESSSKSTSHEPVKFVLSPPVRFSTASFTDVIQNHMPSDIVAVNTSISPVKVPVTESKTVCSTASSDSVTVPPASASAFAKFALGSPIISSSRPAAFSSFMPLKPKSSESETNDHNLSAMSSNKRITSTSGESSNPGKISTIENEDLKNRTHQNALQSSNIDKQKVESLVKPIPKTESFCSKAFIANPENTVKQQEQEKESSTSETKPTSPPADTELVSSVSIQPIYFDSAPVETTSQIMKGPQKTPSPLAVQTPFTFGVTVPKPLNISPKSVPKSSTVNVAAASKSSSISENVASIGSTQAVSKSSPVSPTTLTKPTLLAKPIITATSNADSTSKKTTHEPTPISVVSVSTASSSIPVNITASPMSGTPVCNPPSPLILKSTQVTPPSGTATDMKVVPGSVSQISMPSAVPKPSLVAVVTSYTPSSTISKTSAVSTHASLGAMSVSTSSPTSSVAYRYINTTKAETKTVNINQADINSVVLASYTATSPSPLKFVYKPSPSNKSSGAVSSTTTVLSSSPSSTTPVRVVQNVMSSKYAPSVINTSPKLVTNHSVKQTGPFKAVHGTPVSITAPMKVVSQTQYPIKTAKPTGLKLTLPPSQPVTLNVSEGKVKGMVRSISAYEESPKTRRLSIVSLQSSSDSTKSAGPMSKNLSMSSADLSKRSPPVVGNSGQYNFTLAKSLTNLSNMSLASSKLSLAASNTSLASNCSINAMKNREAKLAFFGDIDVDDPPCQKPKDPFAKYSLGKKNVRNS